jgi:anaerobic magnesium-protoporphyrin IX monomethyl ester cyclase
MSDEEHKVDVHFNEDRDQVIKRIIEENINHADSHLGKLKPILNKHEYLHPRGYNYYSETTDAGIHDGISFVVAPAWGILFPPYNLARLTGLLRKYKYKVTVHDVNVKCHQYLLDTNFYKQPGVDNWWHGQHYWVWSSPAWEEKTLPALKPVLDEAVDNIIADGNPIVGFTLYTSNINASMYMIHRLRSISPHTKIAVGGPQAFNDDFEFTTFDILKYDRSLIDYRITGEGEQELLTLLETYQDLPHSDTPITFGGFRGKLDLNQLPFPDYSDYDLSLYDYSNGVSIETSRGCIAKCTFCAETHFWKYRYRESNLVIDEMKHQIDTYGTRHFWFVDSLANGAFTEFKNLVHAIVEDGLDISWNSYARCDGRMDADLFKMIQKSGCQSLSFGVESGSEKVLTDMKKLIKVWEIENNLRDGKAAGLFNHVNWVLGFPTEGPAEVLHSLHVMYNVRNWVYAISPGATCNMSPFSDIHVNWEKYNIAWKKEVYDNSFLNNWFTHGYVNTILHRFIRLKFVNIWLLLCKTHSDGIIINAQHQDGINNLFKFKTLTDAKAVDYIPQQFNQNFDHFSGKTSQEQLSASLANEHLPYAWALYEVYGPFKIEITHDKDLDNNMYGPYTANAYWAKVNIQVDENSELTFKISHKFNHESMRGADDQRHVKEYECGREDMSFDWIKHELKCNIKDFNGISKEELDNG